MLRELLLITIHLDHDNMDLQTFYRAERIPTRNTYQCIVNFTDAPKRRDIQLVLSLQSRRDENAIDNICCGG